jgi:hypothetical protein
MTSRQEDRLSMYLVVDQFLDATDSQVLALMPDFSTLKTQFSDLITELRTFKNGQRLNRTGYRVSKGSLREVMSIKAFDIAQRVRAYAVSIADEVLVKEMTYNYSELYRMRDSDVADTCRSIYDIARVHVANLPNYGVTTDTLDKLKEAISAYDSYIPMPRANIVERKQCTEQIEVLFKHSEVLLGRMDVLVKMLRFSHALFYGDYFSSRKVIETGNRKLALRGKVTDEFGQPIDKVTVVVDCVPEHSTKTTVRGSYQFKWLPGGVWPVTFKRDGYVSETVFLAITPTLRLDYDISLKKLDEKERSA